MFFDLLHVHVNASAVNEFKGSPVLTSYKLVLSPLLSMVIKEIGDISNTSGRLATERLSCRMMPLCVPSPLLTVKCKLKLKTTNTPLHFNCSGVR